MMMITVTRAPRKSCRYFFLTFLGVSLLSHTAFSISAELKIVETPGLTVGSNTAPTGEEIAAAVSNAGLVTDVIAHRGMESIRLSGASFTTLAPSPKCDGTLCRKEGVFVLVEGRILCLLESGTKYLVGFVREDRSVALEEIGLDIFEATGSTGFPAEFRGALMPLTDHVMGDFVARCEAFAGAPSGEESSALVQIKSLGAKMAESGNPALMALATYASKTEENVRTLGLELQKLRRNPGAVDAGAIATAFVGIYAGGFDAFRAGRDLTGLIGSAKEGFSAVGVRRMLWRIGAIVAYAILPEGVVRALDPHGREAGNRELDLNCLVKVFGSLGNAPGPVVKVPATLAKPAEVKSE